MSTRSGSSLLNASPSAREVRWLGGGHVMAPRTSFSLVLPQDLAGLIHSYFIVVHMHILLDEPEAFTTPDLISSTTFSFLWVRARWNSAATLFGERALGFTRSLVGVLECTDLRVCDPCRLLERTDNTVYSGPLHCSACAH